jgi:DNA-binding IclR family transcriptional regulator
MLSPSQNAEVINWLQENSKRPHKAVMVWARILEHLRMDTGEVMASRGELAERVGLQPRDLSSIITELVSINAIRREKTGRSVRYYLNPNIATHIPTAARRRAEREAAGPLLKLMEGGKSE